MCIRDRFTSSNGYENAFDVSIRAENPCNASGTATVEPIRICLLYTSDAADERSSVDLGGRRIIKKKKLRASHCNNSYIVHMNRTNIYIDTNK